MALPIRHTPVLKGKAAKIFQEEMDAVDRMEKAVPKEDYLRAEKIYEECTKKWGKNNPLIFDENINIEERQDPML